MQVNSSFVQNKHLFGWAISVWRCDWLRLTLGPIGTPLFATAHVTKDNSSDLEYMKDRINRILREE